MNSVVLGRADYDSKRSCRHVFVSLELLLFCIQASNPPHSKPSRRSRNSSGRSSESIGTLATECLSSLRAMCMTVMQQRGCSAYPPFNLISRTEDIGCILPLSTMFKSSLSKTRKKWLRDRKKGTLSKMQSDRKRTNQYAHQKTELFEMAIRFFVFESEPY